MSVIAQDNMRTAEDASQRIIKLSKTVKSEKDISLQSIERQMGKS